MASDAAASAAALANVLSSVPLGEIFVQESPLLRRLETSWVTGTVYAGPETARRISRSSDSHAGGVARCRHWFGARVRCLRREGGLHHRSRPHCRRNHGPTYAHVRYGFRINL